MQSSFIDHCEIWVSMFYSIEAKLKPKNEL